MRGLRLIDSLILCPGNDGIIFAANILGSAVVVTVFETLIVGRLRTAVVATAFILGRSLRRRVSVRRLRLRSLSLISLVRIICATTKVGVVRHLSLRTSIRILRFQLDIRSSRRSCIVLRRSVGRSRNESSPLRALTHFCRDLDRSDPYAVEMRVARLGH